MTQFTMKIPARMNILGNPTDANEGDFATISAAIDVYARAIYEEDEDITIEYRKNPLEHQDDLPDISLHFHRDELPLPYDGNLDLIKASINRLHSFNEEFRNKLSEKGFRITIWSNVPRQSGLGGSSLIVILTLAGLRELYNLNNQTLNDYVLSELTQRVEAKELGITCGYADRYVPLFGGLAYLDYRGKLHQNPIYDEPFVTYERLDNWVVDLPLVIITSGIQHESGDIHGQMRPRYLEEYHAWSKIGANMPPMLQFMTVAWETAWRGKIALLEGDLKAFGMLMNENHILVDKMMTYCGFRDGAGSVNNQLIQIALENGALGAKLTGAGGGGSVFALTLPGEEDKLIETWKETARSLRLNSAQVYRPHISKHGLTIEVD